jgi:hypothetical protein
MDSMDINDTGLRRALAAAYGHDNIPRVCADTEFQASAQLAGNLQTGFNVIIDQAEGVLYKLARA